jgi:hypothetical protein
MFGSLLGKALGGLAGRKLGKILGNEDLGRNIGEMAGGAGGGLLPFKKGGRVNGKRGKPVAIMAHAGEFVLPTSVKPTKAQVKAVNKLHAPKKPRKPRAKKMK